MAIRIKNKELVALFEELTQRSGKTPIELLLDVLRREFEGCGLASAATGKKPSPKPTSSAP